MKKDDEIRHQLELETYKMKILFRLELLQGVSRIKPKSLAKEVATISKMLSDANFDLLSKDDKKEIATKAKATLGSSLRLNDELWKYANYNQRKKRKRTIHAKEKKFKKLLPKLDLSKHWLSIQEQCKKLRLKVGETALKKYLKNTGRVNH